MPLYHYVCHICGKEFDVLQSLGQRDFSTCPECSCLAEKKLSLVNFTFGWVLAPECHFVKGIKDYFVRNVGVWKPTEHRT